MSSRTASSTHPEWIRYFDLAELNAEFAHCFRGAGGTRDFPVLTCFGLATIRKIFARHTHEDFVIAAIADGVEAFRHRGAEVFGQQRPRVRDRPVVHRFVVSAAWPAIFREVVRGMLASATDVSPVWRRSS